MENTGPQKGVDAPWRIAGSGRLVRVLGGALSGGPPCCCCAAGSQAGLHHVDEEAGGLWEEGAQVEGDEAGEGTQSYRHAPQVADGFTLLGREALWVGRGGCQGREAHGQDMGYSLAAPQLSESI
jgi:hypothetical protein